MKKCPACGALHPLSSATCPACEFTPPLVDGFPAYAPEQARGTAGFRSQYFSELMKAEAAHFWFLARNRLITWALGKYCPDFGSFLDVGCGTGHVLSALADAFPGRRWYGSEVLTSGLLHAAARQPAVAFMQMDAEHIPFVDEFDAVGAFDVLEHIANDARVLAEIRAALKPRGVLLLTVPQHPWLWSAVDEYACHVRRYSARLINEKLSAAGLEVVRSTSFVTSLLPAMWLSRFFGSRRLQRDPTAELRVHPWVNHFLETILNIEVAFIRAGGDLPLGGSRLVVARRR